MSFSISSILSGIVAVARSTDGAKLLALIENATNSLAANPTEINFVVQEAAFVQGAVALLPGLEQAELVALAGIVNTDAQALLTPAPAVAVAAKS
jgi:hypothetical protein